MPWTSSERSSDSATLMNPLLASSSRRSDNNEAVGNTHEATGGRTPARNDNNRTAAVAAPMSGHVPSPTSGIHTLRDGVNRTIHSTASPDHQLRHRHHQQQQQQQPNNNNIYNSHSLDDADVAAGASRAPPELRRRCVTETTTPTKTNNNRFYSKSCSDGGQHYPISRSFSTNSGGSRSLGSQTPETKKSSYGGGTGTITTNSTYNSSYKQHSTNFFNQPLVNNDNLPPPPHAQRMERAAAAAAGGGLKGAYGGSEHDFLLLHSTHGDDADDASCSSSANNSSQGDNIIARRRHHHHHHPHQQHQHHSNNNSNSNSFPSMPPLEITTSYDSGINNSNMGNRATSYPPYGLPAIEGSPSVGVANEMDRKRLLQLSGPPLQSTTNHHPNEKVVETTTNNKNSKFIVLGWDLTSYTRRSQFLISASGTFCFSLLYGYLQELISVELCHRKLGLFLAMAQFMGYTVLSYFFRRLEKGVNLNTSGGISGGGASSSSSWGCDGMSFSRKLRRLKHWGKLRGKVITSEQQEQQQQSRTLTVPLELYIGLSILRAIDLGMTNLAMQYVNYPAKTLMKSTRVVFTMIFGVIVTKKRYGAADFGIVGLMVAGLGMFMHADAKTSAVFQPLGIIMLTISLLCDGAISNLSEALMNQYEVGQDEFIFRLYSIATVFICIAAAVKGDLRDGLAYLTRPGTLQEMEEGLDPTWSISGKVLTMALFSTTGFLGSSCSAAITKSFGALTMSITSTARKATTIFLSFALFPNECTFEHIGGIFLFIASLVAKSLRATKRSHHHGHHHKSPRKAGNQAASVIEFGRGSSAEATMRSPLHSRRKALGDDAV